jgi:hypothetical protein
MTDTPFQSGLPGFHAIEKRSAPLWLAMLCHAILLFARPVMNGTIAGGGASLAWFGNAAGATRNNWIQALATLLFLILTVGLYAGRLAGQMLCRVAGQLAGLPDGLLANLKRTNPGRVAQATARVSLRALAWVVGLNFAGLQLSGLQLSGFKLAGPNENGSIACSNRPIRKLVAGTGFEPVTFGL